MAQDMLKFLSEVGKLKAIPRTGWVLCDVDNPETISGHMYRMAIMAIFSFKNTSHLDMNRVIKLALVHDIAECIVGDITPHCGVSVEEKHRREKETIDYLATLLPNETRDELVALFDEYESQETKEAHLTKDLDRLDMVIQAFEYEKKEFNAKGVYVSKLEEFFSADKVISKLKNEEAKAIASEILAQRAALQESDKQVNGTAV